MSVLKIRAALETALKAMTPAMDTAWENTAFKPVEGKPYQRALIDFAEPGNTEFGPAFTQGGYLQVDLCYPGGCGARDATTRVEMLRSTFKRGATFAAEGQTVQITRTPQVLPGFIGDDNRYHLVVRAYFFAQITS